MITLTTPAQINSVLGGNVPVNYDKLVIAPFDMNAVLQTLKGTLRLTSTSSPDMQPILGTLQINYASGELVVIIDQLDFNRRVVLNAGARASVGTIVANAQNAIETGLISLGVILGTQGAGV